MSTRRRNHELGKANGQFTDTWLDNTCNHLDYGNSLVGDIMKELNDIADRISIAFSQLEDEVLELPTEEELLAFEKYLSAQELSGPILQPEAFKDGLNKEAIWVAKDKIKLIREIRKNVNERDDLLRREEQ